MQKFPFAIMLLILMVSILFHADTTKAQEPPTLHEVQPGENLFRIGLRYGVSIQALMQVNGITNPNLIFAGQVLIIPTTSNGELVFGPIIEPPPELIGVIGNYRPLLGSPEDNECNPGGQMYGHCINYDLYVCGWMLARYIRGIITYEQIRPETCRPPLIPQPAPAVPPPPVVECPPGSNDPLCN